MREAVIKAVAIALYLEAHHEVNPSDESLVQQAAQLEYRTDARRFALTTRAANEIMNGLRGRLGI